LNIDCFTFDINACTKLQISDIELILKKSKFLCNNLKMEFDFLDLTNYQHPPCMFTLWYLFLLFNFTAKYIDEWMESEQESRKQEPPPEPEPKPAEPEPEPEPAPADPEPQPEEEKPAEGAGETAEEGVAGGEAEGEEEEETEG
jgi:hypothetical protein